ncbi:MAG: hypothetical protein J7L55_03555, partial [Desulfurococcales archaeon]|nr:hypothetical protein [Desulfurococcales archaeon]
MQALFKALITASLKGPYVELLRSLQAINGEVRMNYDTRTIRVAISRPYELRGELLSAVRAVSRLTSFCRLRTYLLTRFRGGEGEIALGHFRSAPFGGVKKGKPGGFKLTGGE